MTSDGEEIPSIEAYCRVVRTQMDALKQSLEQALSVVPEPLRPAVRSEVEKELTPVHFTRPGATIRRGGARPWFESWSPSEGFYWTRLRSYLIDRKGWSLRDVESLDDASDNVLRHLEDPRVEADDAPASFRTQGLVLGYVQSGKTANYTALIAKAADRGYRLIIVLSGIHNSLRKQTQRRIDLELGLTDDPAGVGLPEDDHAWWAITNADVNGDFKPGVDAGPLQQRVRGLMVIKKNATVLRRLVGWLSGRVPPDLPVLIIDDEADQASINTNATVDEADLGTDCGEVPADKELDPSTINGLIRQLIDSFARSAYVAYTATPFANVLIHPDVESSEFGSDLFPRDFIISLPRPPAYVGAERIFGRPALESEDEGVSGLDVVRTVPQHEVGSLVPPPGHVGRFAPAVTESLDCAIKDWLLATAARIQRLGDGISSMLIHTSSRIAYQNAMGLSVESHMRDLRNLWKYDNGSIRPVFEDRWNATFRPVIGGLHSELDVPFSVIEPHLNGLLRSADRVSVLVLNSSSPDVLDYEADPNLKVILIGGNRLSRGLTLEGLLVSFYVREAGNYDTLLQMGRWFGYRQQYVDLTRLWTTTELVSRFRHLALVEEDLRDQIAVYEREGLTPIDLAPKIMSHPAMLVTAANRMGSAQTVRQSYAGQLLQTFRFRLNDGDWLRSNLDVTKDLLGSLGDPDGSVRGDDPRPTWRDVPWEYIVEFLARFRTAQDATSFDAETASRYVRRQAIEHSELTRWTVSVRCALNFDDDLGPADLGISGVSVPTISRSQLSSEPGSIGVLVNPPRKNDLGAGDEAVDLTHEQLTSAELSVDGFPTVGHALRWQRPRTDGLLLVYPISPFSRPRSSAKSRERRTSLFENPAEQPTVVGIALSFPPSDSNATVEYVVGAPSRHSGLGGVE